MVEALRPVSLLHHFGRTYRDVWRRYDRAGDAHRKRGETWPRYTFAPADLGASVLANDPPSPIPGPGPILDALAAWRPTQGIYRFHPTLLEALWETPVTGELPVELLRQLPEWCVYVETPGRSVGEGKPIHGFFAQLVHRPELERDDLLLGLDFDSPLEFMVDVETIPLVGTLEESLRLGETERVNRVPDWYVDRLVAASRPIASLVSLLLYLCSLEAELRDALGKKERPTKPVPKRRKRKGTLSRLPAAKEATVWETAFGLGHRLEEAAAVADGSEPVGRTVRPHVRRAHWHSYWTGPRDGKRTRTLRWISPLLVKAQAAGGPTVRRVGPT